MMAMAQRWLELAEKAEARDTPHIPTAQSVTQPMQQQQQKAKDDESKL